jgi:hypothetical protein
MGFSLLFPASEPFDPASSKGSVFSRLTTIQRL